MIPENNKNFFLSCPAPDFSHNKILLAHGEGGRLTRKLIEEVFLQSFGSKKLKELNDSAVVDIPSGRIALTTDSFVVDPIFFPGGDIGSLAINGTVNDLAMSGAEPLYLTAGFILEEGFAVETLLRIAESMRKAADYAGVSIIAGDTKVVDKGKCDGIFINTAGAGVIKHELTIEPKQVRAGDAVIVSRSIGNHGIAVMSEREGIEFETTIESDCAPLAKPVLDLIDQGIEIHCLRDLTRGGLASALVEIAESAGITIEIEEKSIPVETQVAAAAEILGIDPIYIANEGTFIAFVPSLQAEKTLRIMKSHTECSGAVQIGKVLKQGESRVILRTEYGTTRLVEMLTGAQLPRIC